LKELAQDRTTGHPASMCENHRLFGDTLRADALHWREESGRKRVRLSDSLAALLPCAGRAELQTGHDQYRKQPLRLALARLALDRALHRPASTPPR
jgi:hypothetical protein